MIAGLSTLEFFGAFGTAATLFGGGLQLGRKLNVRSNADRNRLATENQNLSSKLDAIQNVLNDEADVWLKPHAALGPHAQAIRSGIPVITVCNFKGGVGKTTLTSLLAAYFDLTLGKRVLLIDFDYQGSLTDVLLASANLPELEASSLRLIEFEDTQCAADVLAHATALNPALPRTRLFTCFYGFNRRENTAMMNWVADPAHDIRLRTHRLLSSPEVRSKFDVVIIDAPPRLSTATVNALCASRYVLVPTILDGISVQAALNTLGVIREFGEHLNLALDVIGLVPTMVASQPNLSAREQDSLERLRARLPEYWRQQPLPHIFQDTYICRRAAIANAAGTDLAYNANINVQNMVAALGAQIAERVFDHAGEGPGQPAARIDSVTHFTTTQRRA